MDEEKQIVRQKWTVDRWLCFVFMGVAVIAGWLVPEFYDWTGADQSRPAPVIPWVALGIIVVDCMIIAALVRLWRIAPSAKPSDQFVWRFRIWHLLLATTSTAVFVSIALLASLAVACSVLLGFFWCYSVSLAVRFPVVRGRIIMLWFCQFAPFLWILRMGQVGDVAMLSGLPSLIPTAMISTLLQQRFEQLSWLSITLTMVELAFGVWLSFRGPKRTLAYGICVLTLSIFGSFMVNAVMRA